jgi:metal-responsive CopG/Arc/MetJ family transcriptional regulator
MRTSISLPEPLFTDARELAGDRSFSEFVREAVDRRVQELKRERLGRQMEQGYQHEAGQPSLDAAWSASETEGWE